MQVELEKKIVSETVFVIPLLIYIYIYIYLLNAFLIPIYYSYIKNIIFLFELVSARIETLFALYSPTYIILFLQTQSINRSDNHRVTLVPPLNHYNSRHPTFIVTLH